MDILGWREWIGFPELGITQIKAKVDTGARTSCLHALQIEPFEKEGAEWVRFDIHPSNRNTYEVISCEAPVADQRLVRDSGGHEEMRYVIETNVSLGDQTFPVEVTLTSRDAMKFRVLLGRGAIQEKYMVDPSRSYLVGKRKKKPKPSPGNVEAGGR